MDSANQTTREMLEGFKLITDCSDEDLLGVLCSFVDSQTNDG
jgi:hypothetical protein